VKKLILALAVLLRFYRIPQNLVFHYELGANYLAIKNFIEAGRLPLLGPPTSHPWLSFGPLYYWIFAPILAFFKFNPTGGAYFFALAGVVAVYLNYLVVEKLFNRKTAVISSFILAISPAWISLAREARFFSLSAVFLYPFLLFFVKAIEGKISLLWAGFFLGVMLNFHLSPIILIFPAAILIFSNRKKLSQNSIPKGILGFVIPNLPFLLADAQGGFGMLANLLLWIPYRIAGFVGLYPKNTISSGVLTGNLGSLYEFITRAFVPERGLLVLLIVLGITASLFVIKNKKVALKTLLLFLILG